MGDRYLRHYFLYDRGLFGNLLLIRLGLQGPWTPAFSSTVSKQHALEDLLAICLPNVCYVFGVQLQINLPHACSVVQNFCGMGLLHAQPFLWTADS